MPRITSAQPMTMTPMTDPLGLPMSRMGSGTAWLPDSAPMYGVMKNAGSWMFMLHGTAFAEQSMQGTRLGASQFGVINSGMLNAMRPFAGGRLQLRGMMSLDAFTVGARGYPLLLQTGEQYRGEPIHDRQHPHDLFMEVAAVYERALSSNVAVQFYAAPVGEPALGPVAFPHRPSAAADPFATLAHHWQDATHISFGVVTAAINSRTVKLEASLFNGREPDDVRTNFDFRGARLDAVSARLTINPTSNLSWQASVGRMPFAEVAHPGEAVKRATTSVHWSGNDANGRPRSFSLIAGANSVGRESWSPGITFESLVPTSANLQVFTRLEVLQRSIDQEIAFNTPATATSEFERHDYGGHISVGVIREFTTTRFGLLAVGARGTVNIVPSNSQYGTSVPLGAVLYLRWRTARMPIGGMDGHMQH